MEFGRQEEEEKVYNPTPLQQSAFTMPLPSSTSLHYVTEARQGTGEARNAMGSLTQKPTPTSAPAQPSASGSGGRISWSHSTTTAAVEAGTAIRYRECLRNHAASLGGHILDGCCEFMPCGDNALKCAACGCHRNFHRKDTNSDLQNGTHGGVPLLLSLPHLTPPPPTPHNHNLKSFSTTGILLHAGNNIGAVGTAMESSSEELMAGAPRQQQQQFTVSTKKRFRTKFTVEQKESMMAFAEKIGWRMQKQDEVAIEKFCSKVGVSRQVFKVWMHNNKNSTRKQQQQEKEQQHHEMPDD